MRMRADAPRQFTQDLTLPLLAKAISDSEAAAMKSAATRASPGKRGRAQGPKCTGALIELLEVSS